MGLRSMSHPSIHPSTYEPLMENGATLFIRSFHSFTNFSENCPQILQM